MDHRPIGVFDSGVGGLTVVKELLQYGPNEKIIYFGDTARVPYGSKSKETVTKYAKQIARFLLTKNVKGLIVACNTMDSNSLEELQANFDVPIMGVVEPGASMAAAATYNQKVGVIGTEATIKSQAYQKHILKQASTIQVFGQACPLFVPLAEEGWLEDEITYQVAKRYLSPLQLAHVDTIVLGCTHYPLIESIIQKVMGDQVSVINPALETVERFLDLLKNINGLREERSQPQHEFYVSDNPDKFSQLGSLILSYPLDKVKQVNIEKY
ncbi:MAG: glutamate racemase [Epulopiscium sp.]|nr:glutamate racemase [Candidatus Epulonipiscium sp.]